MAKAARRQNTKVMWPMVARCAPTIHGVYVGPSGGCCAQTILGSPIYKTAAHDDGDADDNHDDDDHDHDDDDNDDMMT